MTINVSVSAKRSHVCEKDYAWNPATCNCENLKYLASMDDSVINCGEVTNGDTRVTLKNDMMKQNLFQQISMKSNL